MAVIGKMPTLQIKKGFNESWNFNFLLYYFYYNFWNNSTLTITCDYDYLTNLYSIDKYNNNNKKKKKNPHISDTDLHTVACMLIHCIPVQRPLVHAVNTTASAIRSSQRLTTPIWVYSSPPTLWSPFSHIMTQSGVCRCVGAPPPTISSLTPSCSPPPLTAAPIWMAVPSLLVLRTALSSLEQPPAWGSTLAFWGQLRLPYMTSIRYRHMWIFFLPFFKLWIHSKHFGFYL